MATSKRYLFPADFMADPSVHVFDGKIYIYPSHDWESAAPDDDFGSEYDMKDYHVLSIEGDDPMTSPVKDWGKVLDIQDVPWARRQLWDNDVVKGRDGRYYMYFPAKDKTDIFRCGVAVSDSPTGPFKGLPDPIRDRDKDLLSVGTGIVKHLIRRRDDRPLDITGVQANDRPGELEHIGDGQIGRITLKALLKKAKPPKSKQRQNIGIGAKILKISKCKTFYPEEKASISDPSLQDEDGSRKDEHLPFPIITGKRL